MKNTLLELGLTDNEADIYLDLLSLGEATAYDVIKKTGLHRNSVYTALQNLAKKRFITEVERNRKRHFVAVNPKRLLLTEESRLSRVRELMPGLQKLFKARPTEIIIHEGERAYRDFWLNIAKHSPRGTVNYVMPSMSTQWWELMDKDVEKFIEYQIRNEIKLKMIVFAKNETEMSLLKRYPKLNEYRYIKRDFDPSGNLAIWGDICYIQSVEKTPVLIEIKNSAILKVFRQHFNLLWEIGKPIGP